jgi:hypothetical protein
MTLERRAISALLRAISLGNLTRPLFHVEVPVQTLAVLERIELVMGLDGARNRE